MSEGTLVNKVVEDGQEATAESQAEKLPFTVRHSGVDTDEVVEPSDEIKSNEVLDADLDGDEIVDPFLAEAMKQGYDPEFDGPSKRTPYEFVEHGKVLNTIHKQNQKIRDLEENARNQTDLIKQGMDKARQETIDSLKAERREAREDGEWDKVDEIDDDINTLREEEGSSKIEPADEVPARGPISQEQALVFAKENPWMYTDKPAQTEAIEASNEYVRAYPDAEATEIMNYVLQQMEESRPDLFMDKVTKPKPVRMVAGQGRTARKPAAAKGGNKATGTTYATLTSQEKRQCDLYVRSTGNTAEQYCADLDML